MGIAAETDAGDSAGGVGSVFYTCRPFQLIRDAIAGYKDLRQRRAQIEKFLFLASAILKAGRVRLVRD
jgi:hypothetical protein